MRNVALPFVNIYEAARHLICNLYFFSNQIVFNAQHMHDVSSFSKPARLQTKTQYVITP